jgi:hypothetical protein
MAREYGSDRDSLSALDIVNRTVQDIGKAAQGGTPEVVLQEAYMRAATSVAPMIIGMIRLNMHTAGIKSRTGKLAAAINNIRVFAGSDGSLVIRMPPGAGQYKGGSDAYEVWASLNYGSVRPPRTARTMVDLPTGSPTGSTGGAVGAKAKRTLKKIALGKRTTKRAREAVERGRVSRRGQQLSHGVSTKVTSEDESSVKLGEGKAQTVVTKPKPFFTLTESQRRKVQEAYAEAFARGFLGLAA